MDIRELRIGNRVSHGSEEFSVVKIGRNTVNVTDGKFYHTYYASKLIPIPLSHDLLELYGFEFIKGKQNIYRTGDEVYQILLGENSLLFRIYEPNQYCYLVGYLRYLHELQNLYYSLTQTELKIKEI